MKSKTSGGNKKTNVLWATKEATDRGMNYYDTNHQKSDECPIQVEHVGHSPKKVQRPRWPLPWNFWNRVRVHLLQRVSGESTKASPCQAEACLLTWETCGGTAARKALIGTATSALGPRAEEISGNDTRILRQVWEGSPAVKGCGPFWILGMSWECARRPADGTFQMNTGHMASSSSSSWRKSRRSTRRWWTLNATPIRTLRMAGPSPMKKVSTMWRTSCCVLVLIICAQSDPASPLAR